MEPQLTQQYIETKKNIEYRQCLSCSKNISSFSDWNSNLETILLPLPNEYFMPKKEGNSTRWSLFWNCLIPPSNILIFRGSYWCFLFSKILAPQHKDPAIKNFEAFISHPYFQKNIYICLKNLDLYLKRVSEIRILLSKLSHQDRIKWLLSNYAYIDIEKQPFYIEEKLKEYQKKFPYLELIRKKLNQLPIPTIILPCDSPVLYFLYIGQNCRTLPCLLPFTRTHPFYFYDTSSSLTLLSFTDSISSVKEEYIFPFYTLNPFNYGILAARNLNLYIPTFVHIHLPHGLLEILQKTEERYLTSLYNPKNQDPCFTVGDAIELRKIILDGSKPIYEGLKKKFYKYVNMLTCSGVFFYPCLPSTGFSVKHAKIYSFLFEHFCQIFYGGYNAPFSRTESNQFIFI